MNVAKKRNFVIVGHAHCGKTSLAESILSVSGATSRKGDVMQGNTVSDFNDDEIKRKISINASFLNITYNGYSIQFIDTPGYADFIGETVASLRACDAAVLVVDAVNGVEVGTEDIWERLEATKTPCIVFINKTDKSEAQVDETIAAIQDQLSKKAQVFDLESSDLVEAVAESDDQLLEKYLEEGSLSADEVKQALHKAVDDASLFPIIIGCAIKDEGVKELLDTIIAYSPSPVERHAIEAKDVDSGDVKMITPSEDGPLVGFIFKSMFDPHLGHLSLFRILSGKLKANSDVFNSTQKGKEHVSGISILKGKEQTSVNEASCGDIVALSKLKRGHVSDTFTDIKEKCVLDPIIFPETSISASIKPKTRADEEKISNSLHRLCEEDHTLKVTRDTENKETIISGIGDLHLKVIIDRMKERYNVDVDLGKPKVSYRETINKPANARHKYKKQSGGRGQYGDVEINIEPLPRDGAEYEFENKLFGGAIPRNYVPSVEKGIKAAIAEGVLAKSPIINIKVTLIDGSYHTVDSSDMAFQIAGALALKEAVKKAGPVLLEPVMEVSIVIPDEFIGDISGDISSRRGRLLGSEPKGKNQVLKAHVPLGEMFKYASDLRSLTGGRGNYTMKLSHYDQAPQKVTEKVVAEKQEATAAAS